MTRIVLLQGHPSRRFDHFCHALADAYARGAEAAGHEVRRLSVAEMDFPTLREREDWERAEPVPDIAAAQAALAWGEHWVIVFPLWLGTLPAHLKGFCEQVFRPGFGVAREGLESAGEKKSGVFGRPLAGRSARLVVTMGMPGFVYRLWFGAHGVRSFEAGVLGLLGVKPVRHSFVGLVEGKAEKRAAWLEEMGKLGGRAA